MSARPRAAAASPLATIPTIAEASRLLAGRKISALELAKSVLDRIAAQDTKLNAFLLVTAERALNSARAADRALRAGGQGRSKAGPPMANSCVASLPSITAPAAPRRRTVSASRVGTLSARMRECAVVRTPAVS